MTQLTPHIGHKHFIISIQVAIALHVLALVIWSVMPNRDVNTVPVKTLSIRLGTSDLSVPKKEETAAPAPSEEAPPAADRLNSTIATPVETAPAKEPLPKISAEEALKALQKTETQPKSKPVEKQQPAKIEPTADPAKRLVRKTPHPTAQAAKEEPKTISPGSPLGNTTAQNAEIVARYEQLLSLWLERHKRYPQTARAKNSEGQAVLRMRIDRQGNIKFYQLEQRTGQADLDKAIIAMVKAANPVPPVPENYPVSDSLLEFLVPVSFKLR